MGLLKHLVRRPEPQPVGVAPVVEDPPSWQSEYVKLANKIGYSFANAIEAKKQEQKAAKLRQFLSENGICVYDSIKVGAYMFANTPRGKRWDWYIVRDYDKPIPEAVLITAGKIKDAFPEAVFQVTDIRDMRDPDPFMRVTVDNGSTWFIIERWDEPAFRM